MLVSGQTLHNICYVFIYFAKHNCHCNLSVDGYYEG